MSATGNCVQSRKQIQLDANEQIGVGIDVHKKSFYVCLWSVRDDREVRRWSQPSDAAALMRKLEPLRRHVRQIAYEAGPTGFVLARAMEKQNWPVIVTSPADIPTSPNAPKCDRKDARRLARLAAKNMLSGCFIPSVEHEDERRMVRLRGRIMCDKNRSQLRIKSLLLGNGIVEPPSLKYWGSKAIEDLKGLACTADMRFCLDVHIAQLVHTRQLLRSCDMQLQCLAERPHRCHDIDLLTSIPGIGAPSALQFLVEIGPRGRFGDRIELAKYLGLAPDVRSSGESRSEGDLNHSGNRYLRTMLIEAAWRWIRYDPNARALYGRMMSNTGTAQKAIVAVARKLGIIMWHLRETQSVYETKKLSRKELATTT